MDARETYVFCGLDAARRPGRRAGLTLADVARRAGVGVGTVSTVMNRPDSVRETTRARVQRAAAELRYVAGGRAAEPAAHWRRGGFADRVFRPAATGWFAAKAPYPARPVHIAAEPWPGLPVRGRNAVGRSDACWLPLAPGLTPHGLRHAHRTLMVELGTPGKLMDERIGHEDGSVQSLYTHHITAAMRRTLLDGLTGLRQSSLDARWAMFPGSRVAGLDQLLREGRPASDRGGFSPRILPTGLRKR